MISIPCDIVLRPAASLKQLAIETSNDLKVQGTHFTLKEGEYYPHLSLYMVQLDLDSIKEVKKTLLKIANSFSTIELTAKKFHGQWRLFDIEYERNEIIDGLQKKVLEAINPLRNGLRKQDAERIKTATGEELENLQKYGYGSVGSKFAPHITLTRFLDEDTKADIRIDPHAFDGEFDSIGLFGDIANNANFRTQGIKALG